MSAAGQAQGVRSVLLEVGHERRAAASLEEVTR